MKKFLQKITALFKKSETEKTSLQKTARIAIIFAAVAIVLAIIYFAAVAPLLKQHEEYVPELFEGEIYQMNSIYILRTYERNEIASIHIKNDLTEYDLDAYQTASGDIRFRIRGNEDMTISAEKEAYLLADVRNLITNSPAGQERVTATATAEDLKNYGLDTASDPAYFEVTLTDGSSYRINIGKPLVTTSGYYVTLEGRKNVVDGVEYDIVYALQSSLADSVLKGSEILLTTDLTVYDQNITQATFFSIEKMQGEKRETTIAVGLVDDVNISASSKIYEMLYPSSYTINEDEYGMVLSNLMYVTASEIVAYGEKIHTPEVYEKYGLDLDSDRLLEGTDRNHAMLYYTTTDPEAENFEESFSILYFSKQQTSLDGIGFYYVYSPMREVIGTVPAETFEFVEWGIAEYTNPYLYFEYFTSCDYFEIVNEREKLDISFTLTGKERTRHVEVTSTGGEIVYTTTDTGAKIPLTFTAKYERTDKGQVFTGEFERFRDLYYVLITRSLALYAEIDDTMTTAADTPYATIKVQTAPKDHPISYYIYENGQRGALVRDEGGNILCHEVLVPTTLSDGSVKNISYEKAFYDLDAGRFFLKSTDSNDGNEKPNGFGPSAIGTVKVNTFLPMSAYGEYDETVYSYEIYDLYDEYIDYDGNPTSQLNATYKYVIPTTTTNTYRLTSGGERELVETEVERAEVGVYIRTAAIDKLFSDTHKLLNGEEIDTMGMN